MAELYAFTEGHKMLQERIIDLVTGEETLRQYTAAEIAEVEKAILDAETKAALELEKSETKAAVLAKLGISEAEAAALLG
jgi:hypothetical protein